MKKVICIDDSEFKRNGNRDVPKVGDKCTVVKSYLDVYDNNDPVFEFSEYQNHMFSQRYFAEMNTDLDETTLVNEDWEEKVCEPVK